MRREILSQLKSWKEQPGRKPLILMGARQTGKTFVLEQFGEEQFPACHYFNFEQQEELATIFVGNLDPKRIINELAIYLGTHIDIQNDMVIFDEIQACSKALTSLKYFCERMPELALCSAGSLLGLSLNGGSFPVGKVDMLHLYPMTFKEFLLGVGDDLLVNHLMKLTIGSRISDAIHAKLWNRLKLYFVVGGMPEAISRFVELQDDLFIALQSVRIKQMDLINAYYSDIAKHSGKINAMHIDRVWRAVPAQLISQQDDGAAKFKFKDVVPGITRYSRLANVFDWLRAAELIMQTFIVDTVKSPLSAYVKENQFKCFMFDIGMLGAMAQLHPKNILDYDYGSYKGYFAENFVLQELTATLQNRLFNWREKNSEVEFLLEHDGVIIPIEVKSGHIVKIKSLKLYIQKYQPGKSFVFSAKNIMPKANKGLLHLPLYLAGFLQSFL